MWWRGLRKASRRLVYSLNPPTILSINKRVFSSYFTQGHEWLKLSTRDNTATIGITDFACEALGDIVYCDLEDVGDTILREEAFGVIESVKASSDVNMPISGEIIEINQNIVEDPGLIKESPTDQGWLIKIKIDEVNQSEIEGLLDKSQYHDWCQANKK